MNEDNTMYSDTEKCWLGIEFVSASEEECEFCNHNTECSKYTNSDNSARGLQEET